MDVRFVNETVWLSQKMMADLFEKDSDTIGLHLKNIYAEGKLDEPATTELFSVVQTEGKRSVTRRHHLRRLPGQFQTRHPVPPVAHTATLLYLVVKNHAFTDGNKRIAAACFLYFLQRVRSPRLQLGRLG